MRRFIPFLAATCLLTACVGTRHGPDPVPAPPPVADSTTSGPAKTKPYEVFGQAYYPILDATGYRARGVASWYGAKFHGRDTANGERYDMYQYTAAHTTLPLPTWVKVTNLRNGLTVIVRVNDRGPFVKNRLIDLSYAAALELGMIDAGTTLVEVEAIEAASAGAATSAAITAPGRVGMTTIPAETAIVAAGDQITYTSAGSDAATAADSPDVADPVSAGDAPAAARSDAPVVVTPLIFLQVGAFEERENAERLQTNLYNAGVIDVRLSSSDLEGTAVHRVQIGPITGVLEYDTLVAQLESIGISDTHLVTR